MSLISFCSVRELSRAAVLDKIASPEGRAGWAAINPCFIGGVGNSYPPHWHRGARPDGGNGAETCDFTQPSQFAGINIRNAPEEVYATL